jgi:hypothetical protein
MLPLSCVNCSFNGLQYDSIGTAVGYCTEHRRILQTPSELTCGRLFRKDLPLISARREQRIHEARFSPGAISLLRSREIANGAHTSAGKSDMRVLEGDRVASAVTNYGRLGTKIESLAQLSTLDGARADIALLSLGRVYVRRCKERGGSWTSGLHLLWWIRGRLATKPSVEVQDIRVETAVPIARQIDLAEWSILMLRLTVLSDLGSYAADEGHPVESISDLAEAAALETRELSSRKLLRWIVTAGKERVHRALSEDEYERLSRELHRDDAG